MTKENLICPHCEGMVVDKDSHFDLELHCFCGYFAVDRTNFGHFCVEVENNNRKFQMYVRPSGISLVGKIWPDCFHIYAYPSGFYDYVYPSGFYDYLYFEETSSPLNPKEAKDFLERWISLQSFL